MWKGAGGHGVVLGVGNMGEQPLDIYYEDQGTGKPVVLLHGWPIASACWEKQRTALLSAGFRVVAHDRRGFGRSSQPQGGHDFDTYADDLHHLISMLDLRDAMLVGYGMGAGEAIRYLGTYGDERVERMALISPLAPGIVRCASNPDGWGPADFDAWRAQIVADRPAFLRRYIDNVYNADEFLGSRISESALLAAWNLAANASMSCVLEGLASWRTDFADDLQRVGVPSLVIEGGADRIHGPSRTGERLAGMLGGCEFLLVEGAPHGLLWTHADEVNAALLDFAR